MAESNNGAGVIEKRQIQLNLTGASMARMRRFGPSRLRQLSIRAGNGSSCPISDIQPLAKLVKEVDLEQRAVIGNRAVRFGARRPKPQAALPALRPIYRCPRWSKS
jgi:hypothetical protein